MPALTLFGSTPSSLRSPLGLHSSLLESVERNIRSLRSDLTFSPDAEIERVGDDLQLSLDLPGMSPEKDVQIKLQGHSLIVSGERKREKTENGYTELSYGSFSRSIELPTTVKEDQVSASYEAGVLKVKVSNVYAEVDSAKLIPIAVEDSGATKQLADQLESTEESKREKEGSSSTKRVEHEETRST